MESSYREFPILYVHDDPHAASVLRYVLGDDFSVLSACELREALQVVSQGEIALVLCDQIVRGVSGVEICARIREARPDVLRMITTTHGRQIWLDAVEAGHIASHVVKPWHDPEFINLLRTKIDLLRMRESMRKLRSSPTMTRTTRFVEALMRDRKLESFPPASQAHASCDVARIAHVVAAALSELMKPLEILVEAEGSPRALMHPSDLAHALTLLFEVVHRVAETAKNPELTVRVQVAQSESHALIVLASRGSTRAIAPRTFDFELDSDQGLDLSMAIHVLRRVGGTLSFESAPDTGPALMLEVPLL